MSAVARTVFFHVGLPKTGTTYLQTLLWNNEDELRRQGVLLPGRVGPRAPVGQRRGARGPQARPARPARPPAAWDRIVADDQRLAGHGRSSATSSSRPPAPSRPPGRWQRLGGAEVHVVVTARDTLSLVTARWQEFVKNGSTVPIDDYPVREDDLARRRVGLGHARPRRRARAVGRLAAARAGARPDAAQARHPAGRAVAALRPAGRHRPDRLRRVRLGAERVARRGRGRAAAPGQRRPRRLHRGARPRQLDPRLPRAGQARAARAARSSGPRRTGSRSCGPAATGPSTRGRSRGTT